MCFPEWLPEMAQVSPWQNGGVNDTYEMLYQIFCSDIKCGLRYDGSNVWIFPEMEDGKEKIFWHLTSREQKTRKVPRRKMKFYKEPVIPSERLPDFRRSEKLPWVKPLIGNPKGLEVLAWDYEEGNRDIKTYVWLKNYDFLVIMKKYQDNSRRLITSFYVDQNYTRKDLERKYKNRIY